VNSLKKIEENIQHLKQGLLWLFVIAIIAMIATILIAIKNEIELVTVITMLIAEFVVIFLGLVCSITLTMRNIKNIVKEDNYQRTTM